MKAISDIIGLSYNFNPSSYNQPSNKFPYPFVCSSFYMQIEQNERETNIAVQTSMTGIK